MDTNNLNVLVEAKKEYLSQLCIIICPPMVASFESMYAKAHGETKGKAVLKKYQEHLKVIPDWNNHTVTEHANACLNTCAWFSDLLAAVFVS